MIVGLFLRNYRCYRATNFIPVTNGPLLAIYIGPNGVGKSSIFDALDKYFNGGDWSVNTQAKRDGGLGGDDKTPFICPIFLLAKSSVPASQSSVAEKLSDSLWDWAGSATAENKKFLSLRDDLEKYKKTHYLLIMGRVPGDPARVFLGPFEKDKVIRGVFGLAADGDFNEALGSLQKLILSAYAYFYIPVETDPLVYTKLEKQQIQSLLDEDIRREISNAITKKTVREIGEKLDEFLSGIHQSLSDYRYKSGYRDSLTLNDITSKVFDSYFSTKILHKKDGVSEVPVSGLSAGEKRRALIDVAYAFLDRKRSRNVNVVLAVDEPDASLHVSACHDQFAKLARIVSLVDPPAQVLLTTHWYGFLPIAQEGVAHSMAETGNELSFTSIDLYSYREQVKQKSKNSKGKFPVDVSIKSYNDLVQSVVASIVRNDPYNWIFCEGTSDKIYLEFFLRDLIERKKLRIVPVGGFKEVRRIYEHLLAPMGDKEYDVKGKVVCLVDTDAQLAKVELSNSAKELFFMRVVFTGGDVVLVKADSEFSAPVTTIEDCLASEDFYPNFHSFVAENYSGEADLMKMKSEYPLAKGSLASYSCMDLRESARARLRDLFEIDDNKVRFARMYVKGAKRAPPKWVDSLSAIFGR